MYKETFSQKLKQARKDAGLTQQEVETMTGIKQQNLCKYESGKLEPNIETLGILCDLYYVSADWLIGTKGNNIISA